jgi:hypothetical protein
VLSSGHRSDRIPTALTTGVDRDGDRVAVEWETTSEIGTAGFHLYRRSAMTGAYERVNKRLLPSLPGSLQGGKYRFIDKNASADESFSYRLVEVEARGRERSFGPYAVDRDGNVSILKQLPFNPHEESFYRGPVTAQIYRYTDEDDTLVVTDSLEKSKPLRFLPSWRLKQFKPSTNDGVTVIADSADEVTNETSPEPEETLMEEPPDDEFTVQTHAVSEDQRNQTEQRKASQARVNDLKKQWTGNRVKISVKKEGLYFLETAAIAGPLGVSASDIKEMLSSGSLLLTNMGKTVSYLPAEDLSGIYFYSRGIESMYTDEDIFWIEEGKGKKAKTFNWKNPLQLLSGQTFMETAHFEEDHTSDITVVNEPEDDYFFWDYVFGGFPGYDSKSFVLEAPGAASVNAQAVLTVNLWGITDTEVNPDHHVVVSLNGTLLGDTFWNGTDSHSASFEFSQELLLDGDNAVDITGLLDSGAPYSLFYIDSFDLTYARHYEVHGNMLEFEGGGNSVVTVTGFTDPDVLLLDISDPYVPKVIVTTVHDPGDGTFGLSFSPDSPENSYLAIARNRALTVGNIWADVPSALSSETNEADYLLITPLELKDGVSRLAGYRTGQGYTTMLVDLEDIMDEFNYGIFSPHAIQSFLSHAYGTWQKPPKYVVLVGEATFDYKDVFGTAENVVPSLLVKSSKGLSPSDNRYADADGDRVPDMAIGRLPVMTDDELNVIIDKIIAYESLAGSTEKKALFIADDPVIGANFTLDSDGVVSLLPQGYTAKKIYLGDYPADTAHSLIIDRINEGIDIINYIGHGGRDRLADEGILLSSDVSLMANMQNLPVMLAFTCTIGQFDVPGYDSLGEALILGSYGGAAAVWSPSGLSINSRATILDRAFFEAIVPGETNVLGDVIREALGEYRTTGGDISMLDIYNLLGDPALKLR